MEDKMDQITTEMMGYICDNLCIHPRRAGEEELKEICAGCKMGNYLTAILAEHEKYSGIVECTECQYYKADTDCQGTDFFWCRNTAGLDGNLKETDGCSRGRRKNNGNT